MSERDTFINYSFAVPVCRMIGKVILPSIIEVSVGIEMQTDDDDEFAFALSKVQHWMDSIVTRCVIANGGNHEAFAMLLDEEKKPMLDNAMMITPMEPTDYNLMLLFHSKIKALADGAFDVISIDVCSSDSEGLTFTYIGDGEDQLPDMDEWVPGPNWFTVPWWNRNDTSMLDTQAPEDADLTDIPIWAESMEFLRPREESQTAIIITGDWEPTFVDKTKT